MTGVQTCALPISHLEDRTDYREPSTEIVKAQESDTAELERDAGQQGAGE